VNQWFLGPTSPFNEIRKLSLNSIGSGEANNLDTFPEIQPDLLFMTALNLVEQARRASKGPKKYRLGPVPVVRLCSTIETDKNNQTIHCLRIPHDGQE